MLSWPNALSFTNDEAADFVIGQPRLMTNAPNQGKKFPGPETLSNPTCAAVDACGNLYVADFGNNRVLRYAKNSATANAVLGQPDFTSVTPNHDDDLTRDLNGPNGIAVSGCGDLGGGVLGFADSGNNRVMEYDLHYQIPDTNWKIVGVGDLNGDRKADVLLRNSATGQDIGWLMDGLTVVNSAFLPTIADTTWEIKAIGDVNGDGKADVLLRNNVSGQNIVWLMNGLTVANAAFLPTIADTNWQIVGPR